MEPFGSPGMMKPLWQLEDVQVMSDPSSDREGLVLKYCTVYQLS
jgi:hypothetical protein